MRSLQKKIGAILPIKKKVLLIVTIFDHSVPMSKNVLMSEYIPLSRYVPKPECELNKKDCSDLGLCSLLLN